MSDEASHASACNNADAFARGQSVPVHELDISVLGQLSRKLLCLGP